MNTLFRDKRGKVLPMRTSGRREKGSVLKTIFVVALIVVVGAFTFGMYNKFVAPATNKIGLTSSLESTGTGTAGSGTIVGSASQIYTDRPNVATFTYQVLDNANDDALITTGINVGALSSVVDVNGVAVVGSDGKPVTKEWLNPSNSNTSSTVSSIPEDTVLSFYGGSSAYYLEPLTNHKLTVGDKINLVGATIQAESSMLITVYDDTGSTALTASTNTTYNDYKITLGEGQEKTVYIKLSNNGADKRFDVKAICTGAEGVNVSSLEIKGTDWTKAIVPVVVDNAQVTTTLDDSTTTTADYSLCYVYKAGTDESIKLDEWEDTPLIKASVNAKSGKNPAQDVVFFTVLDGAWARGSDGKGYFDFYQHDGDEGNVGLTETISSPLGKQLGAIIELD